MIGCSDGVARSETRLGSCSILPPWGFGGFLRCRAPHPAGRFLAASEACPALQDDARCVPVWPDFIHFSCERNRREAAAFPGASAILCSVRCDGRNGPYDLGLHRQPCPPPTARCHSVTGSCEAMMTDYRVFWASMNSRKSRRPSAMNDRNPQSPALRRSARMV